MYAALHIYHNQKISHTTLVKPGYIGRYLGTYREEKSVAGSTKHQVVTTYT
jgi:hypothetical protein